MIRREVISATGAAGGSGAATVNASSAHPIVGEIVAVHLSYQDSPPNTSDVTLAEANNSPAMTVLSVANANTSGWFFPRAAVHDTAGAARTYDGSNAVSDRIPVHDHLKLTIAQADNGDGVIATILWDDLQ